MTRAALFGLLVSAVATAIAAPVPKDDDAARLARIYGAKSDPARDATFDLTGEVLRIRIPKREPAPFSDRPRGGEFPYLAPTSAPRAWRDIPGDFTVTVRVSFPLTLLETKAKGGLRAAGLVVWVSEKEYLVLTRTEWVNGNAEELFYLWHTTEAGNTAEGDNQNPVGNAGFVRLERRGERITGSYSRDGKEWTQFIITPKLKAPGPVKVGVYATHATDSPFEVIFDHYSLTVPKK